MPGNNYAVKLQNLRLQHPQLYAKSCDTSPCNLGQPAAAEQRVPGHTEIIEYEDENGRWHTGTSAGRDRPETDVQDTN